MDIRDCGRMADENRRYTAALIRVNPRQWQEYKQVYPRQASYRIRRFIARELRKARRRAA
jgi:hypothetical protein